MTNSNRQIPNTFAPLLQRSHSAADRAWTGLANFLTAQSVLVLAWAALLAVTMLPGRAGVMLAISGMGVITGLLWALLGTRMWDYHLEYEKQIFRLVRKYESRNRDLDLSVWHEVNDEVRKHWEPKEPRWWRWFLGLSGNHSLLFLAPLGFSLLHMIMIWAVACCPLEVGSGMAVAENCSGWSVCFPEWEWFRVVASVYGVAFIVILVHCWRRIQSRASPYLS